MRKSLLKTFVVASCMSAMAISANGQIRVTQDGVTYDVSRIGVADNELAARIHSVSGDVKGSVIIPERLDTLMKFSGGEVHPLVVGIKNGVLQGNSGIQSLTLPASLKEFPDSAFKDCKSLASVKVPGMSGSVPASCFEGCTSLSDIDLPDGVKFIGQKSFNRCYSLTSIKFPESLDSINYMAFANVPLKELHFPSSLKIINNAAFAGNHVLKTLELPDSIEYLSGFYACSSLTSVKLPRNLGRLGPWAFAETPITSISLPESLRCIFPHAFSGCKGLTEITLPDSVYFVSGFDNCTNLNKINTPKALSVIGEAAFTNCPLLECERLELPDGVCVIYPDAFAGWTKLTEVVLPETVFCLSGFKDCVNLRSINWENVSVLYPNAFDGCVSLFGETIELPDGITNMFPGCLANLPQVKNVKLPEGLVMIGGFEGCTGLTEIAIPTKESMCIQFDTFKDCTSLTEITIPKNVWGVGADTFKGCTSLRSVTIEDSENTLNLHVGYNEGLTGVAVIKRPGRMFEDAPVEYLHIGRQLQEGTYTEMATNIHYEVEPFAGLTTLKTIVLGPSVKKLVSLDCAANNDLQTIKSQPLTPPVVKNGFSDKQYANATLWIPYADFSTSPYASDAVWSKFGKVMFDAAVDNVGADAGEVVGTYYYNLHGVEIASPVKGEVYVVKRLMSTGETKVAKEVY